MTTSYQRAIRDELFQGTCAGCHTAYTPDGATNWSRSNTVNVASAYNAGALCGNVLDYIEPNQPSRSYLFRKTFTHASTSSTYGFSGICGNFYSGSLMPSGASTPYTTDVVIPLYEWIMDGAPNN
jgi:hypothetical protein